jgi:hypothetical protein
MLYVEQSLGPKEEILIAARFHWMYTLQAVMWIMFGLAIGIAIGYAGIWWVVSEKIRLFYPGLPSDMFGQAWDTIVQQEGGYLKILWGLPKILRFSILGILCPRPLFLRAYDDRQGDDGNRDHFRAPGL